MSRISKILENRIGKLLEMKLYLNDDKIIDDIVKALEKATVTAQNWRVILGRMFDEKDLSFEFYPFPHCSIKTPKDTIIIVNKKYVDKPEKVFGEFAIGYIDKK
jgi:hypothetical protein